MSHRPVRTGHAVAAFLALGAVERLWRFVVRGHYHALGEAYGVAAALASGRGFADAYRAGQGPTAHVLPISPAIAAAVYRLFGIGSPTSEAVLACWSIGLALGSYLLLFRAFGRLGLSSGARLGALAFLCLVPAYFWPEAVDFRIWEGGLATFLTALFLDRLLALKQISIASAIGMAFLNALLFFVNPMWGSAAYLCAAVYCIRNLPLRRLPALAALAVAALALFILPWALRNQAALGEPVLLRSNAGLELALAMHPGALEASDPAQEFLARQREIHPTNSPAAFDAMRRAGGEVAYSRELGEQARSWMAAHPGDAFLLAARHVRQALFPDPWQFTVLGGGKLGGLIRARIIDLVALIALIGLGIALIERRVGWVYPTLLILVPALEMSLFQPVQRYTYLFYPLLVYAAGGAVEFVWRRFRWDRASDWQVARSTEASA